MARNTYHRCLSRRPNTSLHGTRRNTNGTRSPGRYSHVYQQLAMETEPPVQDLSTEDFALDCMPEY
jgi:hypothetical protein